jgi:chemotaxis protein MotB
MVEGANLRQAILRVFAETGLAQGPKLEVRVVDEGILISLTDDFNFGMFAIGSAEPQPRVVRAMEMIGELLAAQPGSFVIRGHTDSRAYKSRAFDNWRLSSARAQMAAYMLMRGKLDERRIERVEGHSDRALRNTLDPLAAENRRIEILLRRAK